MKQGDITPIQTAAAQNATSDVTGATVDHAGAHGVMHAAVIGNSADTLSGTVYWTITLEHSDDDSSWAAVDDASHVVDELNSSFNASTGALAVIDAPAEDTITVAAHYVGPKRYSRVVIDATGSHSSGTPVAALAVTSHHRKKP